MRPVTSLDEVRAARARGMTDSGRGADHAPRPVSFPDPDNVVPFRTAVNPPSRLDWCRAAWACDQVGCLSPDGTRRCGAARVRGWTA